MKSLRLKVSGAKFDSLIQKGEAQFAKELFLWVVANVAVYGVDPCQALVNKCTSPTERSKALLSWSKQGLIVGTSDRWTFSGSFLKSVTQHLKLGQSTFGSFSEKDHEEVDLFALVSEFRKGLKSKKVDPYPRITAELRVLCRMYESKEILRVIRMFFKRHSDNYSMTAFSAYLTFHGRKR